MIRRPRLSRIVFTLSYPTLLIALFALIKSGAYPLNHQLLFWIAVTFIYIFLCAARICDAGYGFLRGIFSIVVLMFLGIMFFDILWQMIYAITPAVYRGVIFSFVLILILPFYFIGYVIAIPVHCITLPQKKKAAEEGAEKKKNLVQKYLGHRRTPLT